MEYFRLVDLKIEEFIGTLSEKGKKFPLLKSIGIIYLILMSINIISLVIQW